MRHLELLTSSHQTGVCCYIMAAVHLLCCIFLAKSLVRVELVWESAEWKVCFTCYMHVSLPMHTRAFWLNIAANNPVIYWRRHSGLMVSALDSGSSGPVWSPGWGHCVVFLGKTLYSHSASLHPGVQVDTNKYAGGNPAMD